MYFALHALYSYEWRSVLKSITSRPEYLEIIIFFLQMRGLLLNLLPQKFYNKVLEIVLSRVAVTSKAMILDK